VCEDFSIGRVLTILLLIASLLTGCDAGDRGEPGTGGKSEVGPIPSYPQRPGDPEKGHDALRNRAVTTCGLPYGAYVKARGVAVRDPGPQLSGRAGRNAELPYGLTAYTAPSGVELVTTNCLICHAATIEGQLILGLGNAFLDLTRDPLLVLESMGPLVAGRLQTAEWRRWSDRIAILADYLRTDTAGVNSADNLTLALMAHRDPETLAWSDRPLIEPPPGRPLPLGVPPWWNMRKKHAMFYNGAGRGDQARLLMHASTICTDSVPEALAMDDWLVDVRAYLATLAPPRYPHPIDRPLAERGYSLFRARCRTCHGTYGDDWRYPNKLIALGKVGTDPALARAGFWDRDRFVDWFQRSFYGELAAVSPGLGYVAPPLDGIWATAPYLHNDSVPTLAALLESPARPRYWQLARSDAGLPLYDQEGVGWRYLRLSEGKSGAMSWEARHRVYDTTQKGYGNGGHAFGDALDPQERRALIEYLKTL
jgi:mono/diheme cytochrome c family protein